MSLRELAQADHVSILADTTTGFAWPITVISPSGASAAMTGLSNDIGETIDPDTGNAFSGRSASVVISVASLEAASMASPLPHNEPDPGKNPWLVRFANIRGTEHTFKVIESMPDQSIGSLKCMLEVHNP